MNCELLKLLLLDFDGTLADTRRANTLAYVETLREAGYDLTEEEYTANYFGMRCDEFLTRLGVADPSERERLRLRKIARYPAYFDTVRLNEPLWAFCRRFQRTGGKVWIVSTGSRDNITNAMHHLGIGLPEDDRGYHPEPGASKNDRSCMPSETADPAPLGRVDGIITGTDVIHPKPAPDCFLEAMRRAGCTPAETLIFEDSPIGLEAARRSGARWIKVTL